MGRKLTDLFVLGREVSFDDGAGDPVVVWIQKANMLEHSLTRRAADAARARMLTVRNDPDCDEYQAVRDEAISIGGRDAYIEWLLRDHEAQIRSVEEAKLAFEEEWKTDNYLMGLRDAWDSTVSAVWAQNPEDPEAARVYAEIKRFDAAVDEIVQANVANYRAMLESRTDQALEAEVVDKLLAGESTRAWLNEFYSSQIFHCVRDPEHHKKPYFAERSEVDHLAPEIYKGLREAIENLEVPVMEGKDLPAPPSSSDSPEPLSGAATSSSSGLVAVPA